MCSWINLTNTDIEQGFDLFPWHNFIFICDSVHWHQFITVRYACLHSVYIRTRISWLHFSFNVWSIKIRTVHKLSLWLYYDFFWQSLISYCKFLIPRPLKWSIPGDHKIISSKKIHKVPKTDMCALNFYGSDISTFDSFLASLVRNWVYGACCSTKMANKTIKNNSKNR